MPLKDKIQRVVWSPRQRLGAPQFFLNQKYFECLAQEKLSRIKNYSYGFETLELDLSEMDQFKIGFVHATGILPDGISFSIPANECVPSPITIIPEFFEKEDTIIIYLAIPLNQNEISLEEHYKTERFSIDEIDFQETKQKIALNKFVLITDNVNLQNYSCLPILKLNKDKNSGVIEIQFFIPPSLNILNNKKVKDYIERMHEIIKDKITSIRNSYVSLNRAKNTTSAHVVEAIMFQLLNKMDGYFTNISKQSSLHPNEFHKKMTLFSSELETYTSESKLNHNFIPYNHTSYESNFTEVLQEIRNQLKVSFVRDSIEVMVERNRHGTFNTEIMTSQEFDNVYCIIAIYSSAKKEDVLNHLPNQSKISSPSRIDFHIRTMSAGVRLEHIANLPPSIPYFHEYVYFQMTYTIASQEVWQQIREEGAISFNLSGLYPDLDLKCWLLKANKAHG